MPKINKLPEISENWVVQKSNPLKTLADSKMTLFHLKVLDTYLSRINSHNPEERYVKFTKGELEQILGVTKMHKTELDRRLDGLFRAVTIHDENKPNKFVKIGLFARAECEMAKNGQWEVVLACTQEAMEYIFNIDNIGYLRYRLKNVIALKSKYSYILYIYLADNKFRESWEISVDNLRALLDCKAETYQKFYRFNNLILSKCQSEINGKTDIMFTYTSIKKGKYVEKVRFTVEEVQESQTAEEVNPELKQHLLTFCLTNYPEINPIRADELVEETLTAMQGRKITDIFKYAETVLKQKADNLRKEKSKPKYTYSRSKDLYAEDASRPQSYDLEEFEKMAVNFAEYIDEPQQKIPEPEPVNKKLQSLQEFTQEEEPSAPEPKQPKTGIDQEYYIATMDYIMQKDGFDISFSDMIAKCEEVQAKIKSLAEHSIPVPPPSDEIIASFFR